MARGVAARPVQIKAGRQAGRPVKQMARGGNGGAGPSQPARRQSQRVANPSQNPGVQLARDFTGDTIGPSLRGRRFNGHDLAALFTAITGNPRITVAKVQNLGPAQMPASEAVRAFADGLPGSNLVAANLGEYTASPEAWQHLLQKMRDPHCILGHLYITENQKASNLNPSQKNQMIVALRHNRSKQGYTARMDTQAKRERAASARCWYNPKIN